MSSRDQYNAYINISQATKDPRREDTLIGIFERIESSFQRLEIYTEVPKEVPPTMETMDAIIQIIVAVLSILGIATKEVKQGRTSEYRNSCRVCHCCLNDV
jgi:hypothetical protein